MTAGYARRFVISHVSRECGLRRLTFAMQGRCTYGSRSEGEAALDAHKKNGLLGTLTPEEAATLRVDEVDCYPRHQEHRGARCCDGVARALRPRHAR